MSWQAQTWAIEMGKRYELDPGRRWLLMMLANYADPEGNDIYPSVATLAADTGLSVPTVRRHLQHLMACGLLDYGNQDVAVLKINRADRRPKVYRLCMKDAGVHSDTPSTGVHGDTPSPVTGYQEDTSRGIKRGITVIPKPINPKEKPTRPPVRVADLICRQCDRARPADALSDSGICSDCLGLGGNASAEGAAFREQLRLKRLARGVGVMPSAAHHH